MKIATYNVNGINARLPVLLRWLAESKPDVACLQELKAPDEKFPVDAVRAALLDESIYTYWDYFRSAFSRDDGIRIDHLLLSPELAGRRVGAGVDKDVRAMEKTSDHAPTWIELAD